MGLWLCGNMGPREDFFLSLFLIWEVQDHTLVEIVKWMMLKRRKNWRNKVPETGERGWEPGGAVGLKRVGHLILGDQKEAIEDLGK